VSAVLANHAHCGPLCLGAKVFAIGQETLGAPGKVKLDLGDRSVGDCFEDNSQATIDAVNTPDRFNVELTREIERNIRQFVFGGAQINRPL
jgi:hypothetical protein